MIKKYKTKSAALAISTLGLCCLATTPASAWGPERATFTMEAPASYPTFNSITDNPTIGDERDFVRIGEIDADVTELGNEVEVVPGRQYLVYVYFHNNASSTYNSSAYDNKGVAWRTRMSSAFSTVLTPEEKGTISATITAENSNPLSVWDEAYMTTSANKVLMRYVQGSAKIYNDWKTNGNVMPSSLFTEDGTLLGLNALNGVIPGCEEYHGIVTYVLQAEELGGAISKTVSKDGADFRESVNLAPGEEAVFQLTINNTGDVALTNAVIKDKLPEGLTLVPGSVQLRANDSTTWDTIADNILDTGLNLGTIGTGNVVYVQYKVKAGEDFDCAGQELANYATLTYDSNLSSGDTREDSATITVKQEDGCEEPDIPLDTCENNPALPECQNCIDNPNLPECQDCANNPDLPECQEKNCKTNPEMEGCQELPNTGPLEIAMAAIIIAGIGGGGFYLYRSGRTLRAVEDTARGHGGSTSHQMGSHPSSKEGTDSRDVSDHSHHDE